jgi:hypothetical protein
MLESLLRPDHKCPASGWKRSCPTRARCSTGRYARANCVPAQARCPVLKMGQPATELKSSANRSTCVPAGTKTCPVASSTIGDSTKRCSHAEREPHMSSKHNEQHNANVLTRNKMSFVNAEYEVTHERRKCAKGASVRTCPSKGERGERCAEGARTHLQERERVCGPNGVVKCHSVTRAM